MRTTSSGFERSKTFSYLSLIKYYRDNKAFAEQYCATYEQVKEDALKLVKKPLVDMRLLEIGCGQRFPLTLLFNADGASVSGIDLDYVAPGLSLPEIFMVWRANGFERFAKTLVRKVFYDRSFYRALERARGGELLFDNLDLQHMSACDLSFSDAEFDFIYSFAVFEHIEDVDKAWQEIARVLKPGGYARIGVHLFPSLTGGHHFAWSKGEKSPSATVPAWDHLRENKYPAHLYLNKLTKDQHIAAAKRHLEILDVRSEMTGESLLTSEILDEITGYSRDDLLTESIVITGRK